jgi:hypothetical protein
MKQEHNRLDDFLQEKVESAQFDFKEDYWDKMEALLDEDQKDKKRPFFWRGFSIFVVALLIGAGALLFPKMKHKSDKQSVAKSQFAQTSQNESVESSMIPETSSSAQTATSNNSQSNPTTQSPQSNTFQQGENESNKDVVKNTNTSNAGTSNLNSTSQLASNDVSSKSKPGKKDNEVSKSKNDESTETKHQRDNIESSNQQNNTSKKMNHNEHSINKLAKNKAAKTKPSSDKTDRKNETANDKNKQQRTENLNANAIIQSKSTATILGKNMDAIDTAVYTNVVKDQSNYNPRYIASLKDYVTEKIDSITVVTFKPAENKPLTSKVENNEPKADVKTSNQQKLNPLEFYFMVGANANKGIKGNAVTAIPWGFAPFLSAGLEKQVSSKLSISSQVGFTYFNGLNLTKQVNNYKYSFGVDSTTFSVTSKKLFQMYLPIALYYQFMQKHSVFTSVGLSYAFDVSSLVKEDQQSPQYNSFGYRNGFNTVDLFLQLGYQYSINKNLSAQLLFQQGFMDMTKNNYFENNQSDKQSKISIGIKYNFKRNGN